MIPHLILSEMAALERCPVAVEARDLAAERVYVLRRFGRRDGARRLGITEQQARAWERQFKLYVALGGHDQYEPPRDEPDVMGEDDLRRALDELVSELCRQPRDEPSPGYLARLCEIEARIEADLVGSDRLVTRGERSRSIVSRRDVRVSEPWKDWKT